MIVKVEKEMHPSARVTLVGAGPGDPDLLTIKAVKALQSANVVMYDALVGNEILDMVPQDALKIYVGKRAGAHAYSQNTINILMVDYARKYGHVVRLKGGDSFVFGRGGEELLHVQQHDIPVEVIPGISSAFGVPAVQHIPVTHRGKSESVWVVTATTTKGKLSADIRHAARSSATVVVLMGLGKLREICDVFHEEGKSNLPVAVIQNGSTKNEKIALGTVGSIVNLVEQKEIKAPALIVLGEVVSLHKAFDTLVQEYVAVIGA
ncbi:uroporphyrinogen-III C-methyltransferase [Olivibacter sitiensis]|uniref:uroporphyrinogen-III C-methyltransferase n=1 Tax=Olivibacter sitiensis TaxID=376470 RepID=UPI0003FECD55|nr:uroporphyrinogen-III C-methyltransferase [Olivibacter sitiensis]